MGAYWLRRLSPNQAPTTGMRTSELTEELRRCFDLLRAVIATKPSRTIEIWPHAGPRFLAASDAALEIPGRGTGGFLVVWHDGCIQQREAFVSIIPPVVYNLWEPGDTKIAQLELLAGPLCALHSVHRRFVAVEDFGSLTIQRR